MKPPANSNDLPSAPRDGLALPIVAIAGVVSVGALALRFLIRSTLWLDEALSVNIASLPLSEIPEALRHDGHPPLYYVLLHGWMSAFGTGTGVVRGLSAVITLATLPLVWFAGKRLGGARVGWFALLAFALSPFSLRYGSETRMYSLVIFEVFAGFLVVMAARDKTTPARLVGVAAVTSALLWTHYWTMWLLIGVGILQLIELAWTARSSGSWFAPGPARRILATLAAMGVGGLSFLPWLPSLLYQNAHTGTPWAPPFRPSTLLFGSLLDFAGGPYSEPQLLLLGLTVLLFLGVTAKAIDGHRMEIDFRGRSDSRIPLAVFLVTAAVASAVGAANGMAFSPRYASVYFPFVLLLTALGLSRFAPGHARSTVVLVFVALSMTGLYVVARLDRSQAGSVAEAIRDGQPEALVIACPDQFGPSLDRVLSDPYEVVSYPRLDSPKLVDWVDYASRNAKNDPAQVAQQALEMAGSRPIVVVYGDDFLTLQGQCGRLMAGLGSERDQELVQRAGASKYYESMSAVAFEVRESDGE